MLAHTLPGLGTCLPALAAGPLAGLAQVNEGLLRRRVLPVIRLRGLAGSVLPRLLQLPGPVGLFGLLLPGPEDTAIWEYFATASMPDETNAHAVLTALAEEPEGLSIPALESRVQLRRTTLELLLKVLSVEGAVHKNKSRWASTGTPWTYDAARYEAVARARVAEQKAMLAYENTTTCRMVFLARELDDNTAEPCGTCDTCTEPWYPRTVPQEALTAATVAGLAIVDMVKGVDRGVELREAKVVAKSGGRSGDWVRGDRGDRGDAA